MIGVICVAQDNNPEITGEENSREKLGSDMAKQSLTNSSRAS